MTKTDKEQLKKDYIKLIQTLKSNKFPDDECRYAYMQANFAKTSLKDMNIDELRTMLDFLGGRLWRGAKKSSSNGKATKKQIVMMGEIWKEVARSKSGLALRSFVARVCKRSAPLLLEYLSKDEASRVIVALKRWRDAKQQRHI